MTTTKVAVITGASSGIGRASAIALSLTGCWKVVLTGRRKEALQETASHCLNPENCLVVAGDITQETFVKKLFEECIESFGRLDLLFNNAGINARVHPIEDQPLESFLNVLNVNTVAPFLCSKEAIKIFKKQSPPGGRIINNGSLAAHTPRPDTVPYGCSKHAISGLSKSISIEGRPYDITCTQIDIGNAKTPMTTADPAKSRPQFVNTNPEVTFDVQHVGDAIVHIASLPNDVTVLEMNIMATRMPYLPFTMLSNLSTCEISDALIKLGEPHGGYLPDINMLSPLTPSDVRICGPAYTVQMVLSTNTEVPKLATHFVDTIPAGAIVVIDAPQGIKNAVWGGLMTAGAQSRSAIGAVISGRCRDLAEHRSAQFPIFARGSSTLGQSPFTRPSAVNVSLVIVPPSELVDRATPFPSIRVTPGDWIVADEDGVVCVRKDLAEKVLELGMKGREIDKRCLQDIKAGLGVQASFEKHRGIYIN